MERPKDYEVREEWEELVGEALKEASFFQKVVYRIQTNLFLTIASSLVVGYTAGAYFGWL